MKRLVVAVLVGGAVLTGAAGSALAAPALISEVARDTAVECPNPSFPGGAVAGVALAVYVPIDPC
jgi:hypothetical protein